MSPATLAGTIRIKRRAGNRTPRTLAERTSTLGPEASWSMTPTTSRFIEGGNDFEASGRTRATPSVLYTMLRARSQLQSSLMYIGTPSQRPENTLCHSRHQDEAKKQLKKSPWRFCLLCFHIAARLKKVFCAPCSVCITNTRCYCGCRLTEIVERKRCQSEAHKPQRPKMQGSMRSDIQTADQ
eukprot:scaffold252105_cov41-Prasinocladus_malaysianus.AAC.2